MNTRRLRAVLKAMSRGEITIDDAINQLKALPYEDIGFAKIDHHRTLRQGLPEVVYARGKDVDEIKGIARAIIKHSRRLMITKADDTIYNEIQPILDEYKIKSMFFKRSGLIMAGWRKGKKGKVLIISAGTSDIPVAEEAYATASFLGSNVECVYDVGVAGLHRLTVVNREIHDAKVVVVVAGMEGALPSVIGGMTDKPVIAVPTSTGYGTSMGGLTALLAMLNSCVPGIAVVNIDNGFGAGVLAHRINIS